MRTVLVCVRTALAAQGIATAAARLGLTAAVRTAVSDPEVMLRLAERPADVVLADTALTRPDSVGFTRRVLARSPGAAILLLGTEEPGVAAAAVAAGARGLLQADQDLVSVVAKALLLLSGPNRVARTAGLPTAGGAASPAEVPGGSGRTTAESRPGAVARVSSRPGVGRAGTDPTIPAAVRGAGASAVPGGGGPGDGDPAPGQPAVVPVQRADVAVAGADPAGDGDPILGGAPDPRANASPDGRYGGSRRGDQANLAGNGRTGYGPATPARRITLTERELQVLLGMADGKSNAEIGRDLFVSEDTVKTHARRLFRKLGARDRAHAVAAGFRAGLVG